MGNNNMAKMDETKDTPVVLAYRVGQLEIAVQSGLTEVKNQLINLQHDFATKQELAALQREAELEHSVIRADIHDVDVKVDNINKKRWIQNTLSSILGAVTTLLVGFFIANIGQ